MKIQKLKFSNNRQNWHIEEVNFDSLNLLVGASGVGKTRILSAIALICDVANGIKPKRGDLDHHYLVDFEWSINFSHFGKQYRWELKSESSYFFNQSNHAFFGNESDYFEIEKEKLIQYNGHNEYVIFELNQEGSIFDKKELPKLKRNESMIYIFSEEDLIIPVCEAFKRCIHYCSSMLSIPIISIEIIDNPQAKAIFIDSGEVPTVIKAFDLQRSSTNRFNEFKEYFKDIFSNVEDLRVRYDVDALGNLRLFFEIQENTVWIPQQLMSSGMFHTLTFLIEVLLAPEESVILMDEFENGLGINCMPQLAEFILDQPPSLQFILTSHHPYIIGHLPWQNWQIVSKSGSNIRVRKSTDIPALDSASSLDKFTQLINFLDYEESSK